MSRTGLNHILRTDLFQGREEVTNIGNVDLPRRISADLGIRQRSVENAIRNQVQMQREVGYVFAGSQPSLMKEMLSAKRPFHKAGPQMFLDKIPASDWRDFITRQFRKRGRTLNEAGIEALLATADLIPYDAQRIAHELWDYAE